MAQRVPTVGQGKSTDVNAEGNEKLDNSSSSLGDIQGYILADPNEKIAGMAAGYREQQRTK